MTSVLSELLKRDGASVEAEDDFDAMNALMRERGWSDGLPMIPPTAQRVEAMLAYCDRPWDEPVAKMAPRYGEATPLRLAANAVMSGCRPEYFPLLVLAIEAMCEEPFNLYAIQATTHLCAPLVVVNGPVVKELDINAGHNAFGPGWQANATIGRAIRLALVNIGGAIPGSGDMSTFGAPSKFSYLAAENEEASPWEPLHVERGFARDASTVTVVGAEGNLNMNTHTKDAGELVRAFAETMQHPPCNDYCHGGEPWIVIGPEHAEIFHRAGLSKAELKRQLWEHSKMPAARMTDRDILRVRDSRGAELGEIRPDTPLPVSHRPEDIYLIVAGGPGTHSTYIPSFGNTQSVTRAIVS